VASGDPGPGPGVTQADDGDAEPVSGWAGTPTERGHFRPDIEGLRAVAVIAVLLFHTGVPGFRGGFIGVDVFYVISGFLITGLLRRELLRTGSIDLVRFYSRRARRLLPAALVVIAVTVAVSALVLSRIRFAEVATDGAAAALYVANYRFALEGLDYLTDTTISPLLHYWSLAVEEQFYLFWPVLILLSAKLLTMRRIGWVIAGIGIASFVLSVALTHVAAPLAFYSLPTRAWELALGALLAVAPEPLSRRVPQWAYRAAGWVGLGLIVVSAVMVDPELGYPDLVAAVPTLGAALVIGAGVVGGGAARWLDTPIPRWLGRISYSLYLWHWPILILIPIAIGMDGLAVRIPLALAAVAVAHLSTRWIEQPFRLHGESKRSPIVPLVATGVASVLLAAAAFGAGMVLRPRSQPPVTLEQVAADVQNPEPVLASPRVSGPIPPELRNGLAWAAKDVPPSRRDDCQVDRLGTEPIPCLYGSETSDTTVVLLGDSHAGQWLSAMTDVVSERGWRLVSHLKSACPPLATSVWSEALHRTYDECAVWLDRAINQMAADPPDLIVVAGARHYALVDEGGRYRFAQHQEQWHEALAATLARLRQITPAVVLLADTPRNDASPIDCLSLRATFEDCELVTDYAIDDQYLQVESRAAGQSGAAYISMNDQLCPGDLCPLAFGDYLVYRDSAHVTATFTRILSQTLGDRLTAIRQP